MSSLVLKKSVKKIWSSFYELKERGGGVARGVERGKIRQGALLKVEFSDGNTGHADLHPWPEKREPSLKYHLDLLQNKQFTPLCLRAISIARVESLALLRGINLLSGLNIPLSHYLILDIEDFNLKTATSLLDEGFKIFKVKLKKPLKGQSRKLLHLIKALGGSVKWRVDFYDNLSEEEWGKWEKECLVQIPLECLDFIEAPFDYNEKLWVKYQNYPLALDVWGEENTLPVSVLICKPARKALEHLFKKLFTFRRVVFTHCLAHPLDQVVSAYFAGQFYKVQPCLREVGGLIQKNIYEEGVFTLPEQGPVFPKLSGPGWGWGDIWPCLDWKKVF